MKNNEENKSNREVLKIDEGGLKNAFNMVKEATEKILDVFTALSMSIPLDKEKPETEPDGFWYIDKYGNVLFEDIGGYSGARAEIGNYFETKEEAEKAVEKLKAWKRLKDAGVRFDMSRLASPDTITFFARVSKRGFQADCADLMIISEEENENKK